MSNREKLEALKEFLAENKVRFIEGYKSGLGVTMDLKLPEYLVAVHLSDDNDDSFYKKTFRKYKPFFIRESETVDFIIEKMQNCLTDIMVRRQKIYDKEKRREIAAANWKRHEEKLSAKAEEEMPKRKRVRIPVAERVTPIKKK